MYMLNVFDCTTSLFFYSLGDFFSFLFSEWMEQTTVTYLIRI
jgi:hypothetical protein